jgi:hypothetical protein
MSRETLAALVLAALAVFAWVHHSDLDNTRECCREIAPGNMQALPKIASVKLRLEPETPDPGQTVTAHVSWQVQQCPGCIVLVNVFGNWDKLTALQKLYAGENTDQQGFFTFTAPPAAGTYTLKLVWAYDIAEFSDYSGCNLPSKPQMDKWGAGGECYFYKKDFEVR